MPDTRMLAGLSVFIGCTVAFVALVQWLVWLAGRYQSHFGQVLDVDGPNGNAKPRLATEEHNCALAPLAPVVLANGLGE